ncbi:hypothetical protein AKJ36_02615 [candidate division MSBL1 archaeon SCGC-AAA259I07]|uniref:Uncharacterized protein n=1 Tax=candidate division MSBL1 archaeon SCGC-AAA259I07 TaxID=1698266 RepID=A0A133UKD2_9EURY|nr:hypothetical protein AKJ36_02615 [candidate division MSBL1 archaeon SCGC-AAA259I07]
MEGVKPPDGLLQVFDRPFQPFGVLVHELGYVRYNDVSIPEFAQYLLHPTRPGKVRGFDKDGGECRPGLLPALSGGFRSRDFHNGDLSLGNRPLPERRKLGLLKFSGEESPR